eukprot:5762624-Amphidinium_carterae.1
MAATSSKMRTPTLKWGSLYRWFSLRSSSSLAAPRLRLGLLDLRDVIVTPKHLGQRTSALVTLPHQQCRGLCCTKNWKSGGSVRYSPNNNYYSNNSKRTKTVTAIINDLTNFINNFNSKL